VQGSFVGIAQAAQPPRPVARRTPIAAPLFAALLASCALAAHARNLQGEGLGSTWKVTLPDRAPLDAQALQRGIQQRIDNVTHQLSRWDRTSSLSAVNAATTDEWQPLPSELFLALSYALKLAKDTAGAYDPTVGPLVDVWGFGTPGRRFAPPSADEIAVARTRVGWAKVALDADGNRARRPVGVQIDLSSMTHGLAADQVATYLESIGVTRYLIDVGSELRARGDAPEGRAWRVAIERPPAELTASAAEPGASGSVTTAVAALEPSLAKEAALRTVALRDASIATSGNYRYYFDYNGRRYSHRIDPRTAEPISNALASVTVIASECMHADALATALTVLGPDEGLVYAQRHGIAALFVLRTGDAFEERTTDAFEAYLDRR
jgi:FAD:protein FMN transferase